MSMEMESKPATRSVIARLMGLDELPPQQPVQKKQRVLSDNYLRRVASIGVREKHSEYHSLRQSVEDREEYKHAFQVLKATKMAKHHDARFGRRGLLSTSSGLRMTVTGEKFTERKCVSADMNLPSLEECHDVQEVTNLKTNDFHRYCQDLSLSNRCNDLQNVPWQLPTRIAALTSLYALGCRDIGLYGKSGWKNEQGYGNSVKKVENGRGTYSSGKRPLDYTNKLPDSPLESRNGSSYLASKVVVQKPNLGKLDTAARQFPSTISSCRVSYSDDKNHKGVFSLQNSNYLVEVTERKNLVNDRGIFRPRSRFSKDRFRKMGHGISSISTEVSQSEDSSSNCFGNYSDSNVPSSPIFSNLRSHFPSSDGPSAAIPERWKIELSRSNRTLNEMVAIPDSELKPLDFDNEPKKRGLRKQVDPGSGIMNFGTPLGVSTCNGPQDRQFGHLRSRSLLPNFNAVRPQNSRHMRSLESIRLLKNKSMKQESDQKGGLEHKYSDRSYKNSESICCVDSENNHMGDGQCGILNQPENELEEKDSGIAESSGQNSNTLQDALVILEGHMSEGWDADHFEQNYEASESPMTKVCPFDAVSEADTRVVKWSPLAREQHQLESKNCILPLKDEYASHFLKTSVQQDMSNPISEEESVTSQCYGIEPGSPTSLDEAYQPSPNSVLGPSYRKEIATSPASFSSVGASLHGLQMQLELLKSETLDSHSEGSGMMVSSDEDIRELSVGDSEEHEDIMRSFQVEESRDFSYLVDVLTEAGLQNKNEDTRSNTWHSQEGIISSSIFEALEKKYGEQISWKRSDRKLLFDRINIGLAEVLRTSRGVPAWTKLVAKRFSSNRGQGVMIEEELWMILVSQEKDVAKESEKVLGKDDKWLDLEDDIEFIGREIEDSLIDELMADVVVSTESF